MLVRAVGSQMRVKIAIPLISHGIDASVSLRLLQLIVASSGFLQKLLKPRRVVAL